MFLKQGVLPPTVELAKPIQPTPAWRVKSGLIRRFGLVPQWVRTLSTHAIASQAQSHRLKPNLTRLDRNSLTLVSEVLKKGQSPLTAICYANFAYPHGTKVFSSPPYAHCVPIIKPPFRRLTLPILAYPPFLFETGFLRERSRGFLSTQKKGGRFCGRLATMKTKLKLLSSAVCRECEDYCAEDCRHCRGFGNCRDCQHNRCRASNVDEVYLTLEL